MTQQQCQTPRDYGGWRQRRRIGLFGLGTADRSMRTRTLAQSRPITLPCSPGSNGGTLAGGTRSRSPSRSLTAPETRPPNQAASPSHPDPGTGVLFGADEATLRIRVVGRAESPQSGARRASSHAGASCQ